MMISSFVMGSGLYQGLIHVGTAVARGLREDAAAWIAEVALAVEFADIPRGFGAYPVDGADEIAVGHSVGGLLQFPQIFAETGDGGRGVEDDLGAGQSQG